MMRILFALLLLIALSVSGGAEAQTNERGGGTSVGSDDRDSNDNRVLRPPRRTTTTPTPRDETVIIVPAPTQRRTPPRRVKPRPNPKPKPTRRVPRLPPGKSVLSTPLDLAHSIRTPMIRGDARLLPNGAPEFIALGPQAEAGAAVAALVGAGAMFVRQRPYPALDLRALVFDPQGLTPAELQQILATAAPGTQADTHAIYRLASGAPRLYAAALVNPPDTSGCALPGTVRIGQIDGPVEPDHAVLQGTSLISHSVLQDTATTPTKDHGTAVAALLVGQDETGALAGFASGAQLFAASAFGAEGAGGASDIERITAALDWLVGQQAQLINLSFAGPVNDAFDVALQTVARRDIALIAAAGNDGRDAAVYPAAADPVIGVTAIDAALRRYRSANTGPHIDFAAPGVDVYVANATGGGYATGTSYAAPILTGLAARLVAQGVTSPTALREQLQGHSVDLGDSGRDSAFGWGLVKELGC